MLGDFVAGLESGDRGKINRAISEITILQEDMAIVLGDVGSAINNLDRQSDINSDTRLRVISYCPARKIWITPRQ